jgi:hypothetical protein
MEIEKLAANNEITRMRAKIEEVVHVFDKESGEKTSSDCTMNDLVETLDNLPDQIVKLIYDHDIEKPERYVNFTRPCYWEAQFLLNILSNFRQGSLRFEMFDDEKKILISPKVDNVTPSTGMFKNIAKSNYRRDGEFTFLPPEQYGQKNGFWAIIVDNQNQKV